VIVYKNVCDYCGSEEIIEESCLAFVVQFTLLTAYEQEIVKKRHFHKPFEVSFCGKECYVEWIKSNLREDGSVIGNED
jgi:hypothetical protein